MRLAIYILAIYTIVINLIAFIVFGVDKYKAKREYRRVSESTLLWLAFAGGSVGALLGMLVFHHKTNHLKFRILVPMFFMLHIVGTAVAYWYLFINVR